MANGLFGGGDGTAGNPFLVEDAPDLDAVRNARQSNYKQVNNVDLSVFENWEPLGNVATGSPFMGRYDGGNYAVKNIKIKDSDAPYVGLFGIVDGAELDNINVEKPSIIGGSRNGLLASQLLNATVTNCHVDGEILGAGNNGGFATTITNSIIDKCSAKNIKIQGGQVGGFATYVTDTVITNSFVTGETLGIDGEPLYVGGLFYDSYTGDKGNFIDKCYIVVKVTGDSSSIDSHLIAQFWGDRNVTSTYVDIQAGGSQIHWLAGKAYSYRGESLPTYVRGVDSKLYLLIQAQGGKDYDYWEPEWSETGPPSWWPADFTSAEPGVGARWQEFWREVTPENMQEARFTDQMMTKDNYVGWDFENIWDIHEGESYPFFKKPTPRVKCMAIPMGRPVRR